ncbi:MAG: hypothetical protein LIO77_06935, partial [Rikenellaceae bacterium]|nr:hypothetical protein [Rikenellaceae bacterium]
MKKNISIIILYALFGLIFCQRVYSQQTEPISGPHQLNDRMCRDYRLLEGNFMFIDEYNTGLIIGNWFGREGSDAEYRFTIEEPMAISIHFETSYVASTAFYFFRKIPELSSEGYFLMDEKMFSTDYDYELMESIYGEQAFYWNTTPGWHTHYNAILEPGEYAYIVEGVSVRLGPQNGPIISTFAGTTLEYSPINLPFFGKDPVWPFSFGKIYQLPEEREYTQPMEWFWNVSDGPGVDSFYEFDVQIDGAYLTMEVSCLKSSSMTFHMFNPNQGRLSSMQIDNEDRSPAQFTLKKIPLQRGIHTFQIEAGEDPRGDSIHINLKLTPWTKEETGLNFDEAFDLGKLQADFSFSDTRDTELVFEETGNRDIYKVYY